MAAIQPNSTIKIFHGMPLDNNYDDTLYFANKGAQYSWFSSSNNAYLKYTFDTQTYQRVNSGVFRCSQPADDLYDCNYMIFKNTSYGSKWFFAFITSVEYDNNQMSLVYYEIDYIQTYLYDGAVLEQCMIEREHTVTDVIGEHILPEPVECGDYEYQIYGPLYSAGQTNLFTTFYVAIIVADQTTTASPVEGGTYDNIYCGAKVWIFRTDANSGINTFLQDYMTSPQSIIAMYMIPKFCLGPLVTIPDSGFELAPANVGSGVSVTLAKPNNATLIGHYTPKNKKLYTYPYCFFQAHTPDGNTMQLKYEFFSGNSVELKINSSIMQPVQIKLTPVNYKTITTTEPNAKFMGQSLVLTGFPMCGWAFDAYAAWQAMNETPLLVNTGLQMVSSALSLNPVGVIGAVSNMLCEDYRASMAKGQPQGNFASGSVDMATNNFQFYGGMYAITEQYAKVIDGFFTEFGYKVNRVGTPSLNNRPHWTYVKTIGCKVRGTCPGDAIKKICQVFDKGITFWVTASEVGNYSLDNAPVSS